MINKIKIWIKGIIEKLLSWGKDSPAEEDDLVFTPSEIKALVERLKEALEKNPEDIKIISNFGPMHLLMGICFAELGRYDETLGKIQDALNFDKNLTIQAHYNFVHNLQ
jgi:tetratricopeptide (TPR) repeat protein